MESTATVTSNNHTGGRHGPNSADDNSVEEGIVHGGAMRHTATAAITIPQVTMLSGW